MFTKAGSTFHPLQVHAIQAAKARGLALIDTLVEERNAGGGGLICTVTEAWK
jgi:hypothetical protein